MLFSYFIYVLLDSVHLVTVSLCLQFICLVLVLPRYLRISDVLNILFQCFGLLHKIDMLRVSVVKPYGLRT